MSPGNTTGTPEGNQELLGSHPRSGPSMQVKGSDLSSASNLPVWGLDTAF